MIEPGNAMKKIKLSEEDRCAIDLVLEQRAAAGGSLEHCFGKPSASLQKRVKKVSELFDTLGQLPTEEPRTNLAAATMKFIRQHEHEVPAHTQPQPARRPVMYHAAMHRALQ
jgi:hypothetical protein